MKKSTTTALAISSNTKTIQVLMPSPDMDRSGRINYFHSVAEEAGEISIKAALFAGLELMKAKQDIPHGGYEKWIDSNCSFGVSTAKNYVAVATEYLSKKFDIKHLISSSDAERQEAVEETSNDVGDASLRQLYIELGIVKKSKSKMGGDRSDIALRNGKKVGRPTKEQLQARLQQQEEELGADSIQKRVADLFAAAVTGGGLGNCDDNELASAVDMLKQIVKCGEEIIKSRKRK